MTDVSGLDLGLKVFIIFGGVFAIFMAYLVRK